MQSQIGNNEMIRHNDATPSILLVDMTRKSQNKP